MKALFNRNLADGAADFCLADTHDAGRDLRDGHAQTVGQLGLHGLLGLVRVERNSAAQKVLGIEIADQQGGVGEGRRPAALAVAGWAGPGAGTVRADLQVAALVNPADAAPAGADRLNIQNREGDR